jgi:hypothetical protein
MKSFFIPPRFLKHPDLDLIQVAFDFRTRHIYTVGELRADKVASILSRCAPRAWHLPLLLDYRDDTITFGRRVIWEGGARDVLGFCIKYDQVIADILAEQELLKCAS